MDMTARRCGLDPSYGIRRGEVWNRIFLGQRPIEQLRWLVKLERMIVSRKRWYIVVGERTE